MARVLLSTATYNLWAKEHWIDRKEAIDAFFKVFQPDVLCIQEFSDNARELLKVALPNHEHVTDNGVPGWATEGNIYWNKDLFTLIRETSHGAEQVGMEWKRDRNGHEFQRDRRLFWVRLRLRRGEQEGREIFVSTAHFTYKGYVDQACEDLDPRGEEIRNTIAALKKVEHAQAIPMFFMGDVNDTAPIFDLAENGFVDCFTRLRLPLPPTVPVYPKGIRYLEDDAEMKKMKPMRSMTSDVITSNDNAIPVTACVPHFYHKGVAPSDHWPVMAVYELKWDGQTG
jgi:hypothetical protein